MNVTEVEESIREALIRQASKRSKPSNVKSKKSVPIRIASPPTSSEESDDDAIGLTMAGNQEISYDNSV